MSTENVKRFCDALKTDPSLMKGLKAFIDEAKPGDGEEGREAAMRFAAEKGFVFSMDDIKAFDTQTRELSRDELNDVNAADGHGAGICVAAGVGFGRGSGSWGSTACFALGFGSGNWADWSDQWPSLPDWIES